jgi:HAMP domain-containing protein
MRRLRSSVRVALAGCVLALVLLTAGATAAGYLAEARNQSSDRAHLLAAAEAYVRHHATPAETTRWQQAMTRRLTALGLRAQLTMVWLGGKHVVYASSGLVTTTTPSPRRPARDTSATAPSSPSATQPSTTCLFPLARGSGETLTLDLYAPSPDRTRPVLVALTSGLASLLAGAMLLIWATSRWLVAPLRRLNTQVDAIAGGDPFETRATSPIREVENVATAVAGMAARLAQTAEHDARLEAERRLLVSSIAHDLRTPLFALRGYLDAIATGIGDPGQRLDRAQAKAQQIDRLVTGLFDYARADIDERPRLHDPGLRRRGRAAAGHLGRRADRPSRPRRLAAGHAGHRPQGAPAPRRAAAAHRPPLADQATQPRPRERTRPGTTEPRHPARQPGNSPARLAETSARPAVQGHRPKLTKHRG